MKNILLIILFFSSLALKAQFEIPSAADVNKFFTTKKIPDNKSGINRNKYIFKKREEFKILSKISYITK